MLYQSLHVTVPERRKLRVFPTGKLPSKLGTEEFLRVSGTRRRKFFATRCPGLGVITSLTRADGIIRIPSLSEGLAENEETEVELLKPVEEIINTVVMVGATISPWTSLQSPGEDLPSDFFLIHHVGSLGGLLAIKKKFCHIAGAHLLDPGTGEYNFLTSAST